MARVTVGALFAGVCVAAPGAQAATDSDEWADASITPGQTLILVTAEGSRASLSMSPSDASTLPAGWSVISRPDGLRMTAPTRAKDGDFATVQVTEKGEKVDEIKVEVDGVGTATRKKSTATSTVARVVETVAEPAVRTVSGSGERGPVASPFSSASAPATAGATTSTAQPDITPSSSAPRPDTEQATASTGSGWLSDLVDRVSTFFGG